MALAVYVRARREELELTVKAAALAAGVSTKWWTRLEAAQANPRGDMLGRAARVLGVTLAELRAVLEANN